MAQKNATPTKEQKAVLARHGMKDWSWAVIRDMEHSMIVKNKITGEFRVINKKG